MTEPATESYEIKNKDSELHVINVILEALYRHITNKEGQTSEEYEKHLEQKRVRVVRYVLDRVDPDKSY